MKKKSRVFGFDLGLNNVGWAVVDKNLDEKGIVESVDIVSMGTYVFQSPLVEDSDASTTKTRARGAYRRARRTLRRRKVRKTLLYNLLAENGFLPADYQERVDILCGKKGASQQSDPFVLRNKAVHEKLTAFELGRVLCHLNQRRGYLSPRDLMVKGLPISPSLTSLSFEEGGIDEEAGSSQEQKEKKETKVTLKEIADTRAKLGTGTYGEFLYQRIRNHEPIRKKKIKVLAKDRDGNAKKDKNGDFEYKIKDDERRWIRHDRSMIEAETNRILEFQVKFHPFITDSFKVQVLKIMFDQGQIGPQMDLRGKCVFFPEEARVAKASMVAQGFVIAQELAHLRLDNSRSGHEGTPLSEAQRRMLYNSLIMGIGLNWSEARQVIGVGDAAKFTEELRQNKGKEGSTSTKKNLRGSATAGIIKDCLPEHKWKSIIKGKEVPVYSVSSNSEESRGKQTTASQSGLDEILTILLTAQGAKERSLTNLEGKGKKGKARRTESGASAKFKLLRKKKFGPDKIELTEEEAVKLATCDLPKGYSNLSRKLIKKLMPHLLNDCNYDEAVSRIGLNHAEPQIKQGNLQKLNVADAESIGHPLVRCSVQNAIRVVNDLIAEYEMPDAIHVELPRDLARSSKEREEIEKQNKDKEDINAGIRRELAQIGKAPSSKNVEMVLLWREFCDGLAYEPEIKIASLEELFSGNFDVDHIVPRSYSLDDSRANKVICTSRMNRQIKLDQTPYEALHKDHAQWQSIKNHLEAKARKLDKDSPLRRKIKRILSEDREEYQGFEGTHLAATGYISRSTLALFRQLDVPDVIVAPGKSTAELRSLWGLDNLVPLHPEEQKQKDEINGLMQRVEAGESVDNKELDLLKKKKKARSNFKHHALDALVVALTDRSSLLKVVKYYKEKALEGDRLKSANPDKKEEDAELKRKKRLSSAPDEHLRAKACEALEEAVIVHRPNRRVGGEINKASALRPIEYEKLVGEPLTSVVIDGKLYRRDHDGKPAQMYALENNHHIVIWESLTPNKKGEYERSGQIVTNYEAYGRSARKQRIFEEPPRKDWRIAMTLCKGDTVEMDDETLGVVSMFSRTPKNFSLAIWQTHCAQQMGKINVDNPYLIVNIRSDSGLNKIRCRRIFRPAGAELGCEGLPD